MKQSIQIQSRVGEDGVLDVHLKLGLEVAKKDVMVTIQPIDSETPQALSLPWRDFVERTYGSCAGLGLERPEQGSFEMRESLE